MASHSKEDEQLRQDRLDSRRDRERRHGRAGEKDLRVFQLTHEVDLLAAVDSDQSSTPSALRSTPDSTPWSTPRSSPLLSPRQKSPTVPQVQSDDGPAHGAQSRAQPRDSPTRLPYDRDAPGGLPTPFHGFFLYQNTRNRLHELMIKLNLAQARLQLTRSEPDLATLLIAAHHASKHAHLLRDGVLIGQCAYYRGRAELALEDWHGALRAMGRARHCIGRCLEGDDVEIRRDDIKSHLKKHELKDWKFLVEHRNMSEKPDIPHSDAKQGEEDALAMHMNSWHWERAALFLSERWRVVFNNAVRAQDFIEHLKRLDGLVGDSGARSREFETPGDATLILNKPEGPALPDTAVPFDVVPVIGPRTNFVTPRVDVSRQNDAENASDVSTPTSGYNGMTISIESESESQTENAPNAGFVTSRSSPPRPDGIEDTNNSNTVTTQLGTPSLKQLKRRYQGKKYDTRAAPSLYFSASTRPNPAHASVDSGSGSGSGSGSQLPPEQKPPPATLTVIPVGPELLRPVVSTDKVGIKAITAPQFQQDSRQTIHHGRLSSDLPLANVNSTEEASQSTPVLANDQALNADTGAGAPLGTHQDAHEAESQLEDELLYPLSRVSSRASPSPAFGASQTSIHSPKPRRGSAKPNGAYAKDRVVDLLEHSARKSLHPVPTDASPQSTPRSRPRATNLQSEVEAPKQLRSGAPTLDLARQSAVPTGPHTRLARPSTPRSAPVVSAPSTRLLYDVEPRMPASAGVVLEARMPLSGHHRRNGSLAEWGTGLLKAAFDPLRRRAVDANGDRDIEAGPGDDVEILRDMNGGTEHMGEHENGGTEERDLEAQLE